MSILKIGMYASNRIGAIPEQNYLTFSSDAPFSIKFNQKRWDGVLEYSLDAQHWYEWDASEINSADNTLYLRGSGNTVITNGSSSSHAMIITSSSGVSCAGNIMTLLDHMNPDSAVVAQRAFAYLFFEQDKLLTSPELPATQLATDCYRAMFYNTNLTVAPELPATQLATDCYRAMFYGTNLTVAPELPATQLAEGCYYAMFRGCTNLTVAPELPATQLATDCYRTMFYGTNLTVAPELPATQLAEGCYYAMFMGAGIKISETQTGIYQTPWRIPSVGTIASEPPEWNLDMLTGTSGTFTSDPTINTTYYQAG